MWSCVNNNSNSQEDSSRSSKIDDLNKYTLLTSEPFLKNTTYVFTGHFSNPVLLDTLFTPPAEYQLNKIIVQINIDKKYAIVTTNEVIRHKILSIDYYKVSQYYIDTNGKKAFKNQNNSENYKRPTVAVINTNRGKILILEPSDKYSTHKYEYELYIEYGSFIAGDEMTIGLMEAALTLKQNPIVNFTQ